MAEGTKVGGVYTPYSLDIAGLRRGVQEARTLLQQLRNEARQPIPAPGFGGGGTPRAPRAPANDTARRERELRRLADSEIRAARAAGDHARALQLIDRAMQAASGDAIRFNNLLAQQSQVQRTATREAERLAQAQRTMTPGQEVLNTFKNGLVGIVGPAALATAAIGGVAAAAQGLRDGLELRSQLDTTNAAIRIQVQQLRDYGQVQREAQAFADAYKLTQQDLAGTLQAAIPVFRASNATTTETLETFLLLQRTAPEKPISEAARAIRELASGDVTSIKELFNVPARDAHAMKEAIAAGQDPVKVVADYLKRAGADAELLKIGTTGAAGALKDAARASEELSLAQGQLAQSAVPLIGIQSSATRGLARVLRGDLIPTYDELAAKAKLFNDAYAAAFARSGSAQLAQVEALVAVANGTAIVTVAVEQTAQAVQLSAGAYTAAAAGAQAAADRQATYNAVARDTIALSAEDIITKQQQGLATDRLTAFQKDLEAAALRVATGQATQGQEAAALAATYPELAGQIGQIINRQLGLADTIDAANRKLREQQLLAQQKATVDLTGGRGPAVGGPGRRGNDVADFDRFLAEQQAADEARRRQQLALADTAGRVRLLRDELAVLRAKGAAEDAIINKETELKQAERQLASESQKTSATRVRAAERTSIQLGDIARTSAAQIEQIERDHLQRMQDMQEDYEVRRGRAQEDYERRRRRLLAEGKIFEAQQLKEEFEREQRRDREDFERQRARQDREVDDRLSDQGGRVDRRLQSISARTGAPAQLPGTSGGAPGPLPTQAAAPAGAPVPAAAEPRRLEITFAPIQLVADGRVLAEVTYPRIEQLLVEDLARIAVTAAPEVGQGSGASGPRP
jgi:hypothetical protein